MNFFNFISDLVETDSVASFILPLYFIVVTLFFFHDVINRK